ncbi:MAG: Rid family detoxifying hydrolase [bacterium]
MDRRVVATEKAPAAIGPYSQAIVAGGFVFTAGQIALVPGSGRLVDGGAAEQTEQVLANLDAVLTAAGSSLAKVVKTTIFLVDMADFAAVNEVYARRFGEGAPARSTVAAKALPKGAVVEIDAVALAG